MRKSRGIWIDAKGYLWIRIWPFSKCDRGTNTKNSPYLEYIGPYSAAALEVAEERLHEIRLQLLRKTFKAHGEMLNDGFHGLNVPNEEQAWMILSFMYSLSRYPYARRITFLA